MAAETDPHALIPWPSITSFPQHVVATTQQYFKGLDGAAGLIARAWRASRDPSVPLHPAPYVRRFWRYPELRAHLAEGEMHGHHKLDGTNTSKAHTRGHEDEPVLFGRRQRITGTTYQKVPLDTMHAADIAAVRAAVVADDAELDAHIVRTVVYGELVCNRLYDYVDNGVFGTWQCFGILVTLDSEEAADHAQRALAARGFALTRSTALRVRLVLCPALRELFGELGLPTPAHFFTGSLLELVEFGEDHMMRQLGEGVVVGVAPVHRHARGDTALYKWKGGQEAQGSNDTHLAGLLRRLEDPVWAPLVAELPRLVNALAIMLRVARHRGEKALRPPKPPKAERRAAAAAAARPAVLEAEALEAAVESALTKYDALDAFFERGKAGHQEIVRLVVAEVRDDLITPETPPEAATEVTAFVNRYLGKQYGLYKAAHGR